MGVIQGASRESLKHSTPDMNSVEPHGPHCGLLGLKEFAMTASKSLIFL